MAHPYDHDPAPVYCTTCGRESGPGDRFCENCGSVLDQGPGSPAYAPGMPYFGGNQQVVEYMGFWIRAAALIIDTILLIIVNLIIQTVFGGSLLTAVLTLIINFGYGATMTAWRGQTVGKMVVGIQVVDRQGNIPGIGVALLREVVGRFLSALPFGLGYLWVAWDREKRGWHDHIAGTYVVRKRTGNQVR